MKSEEGREKTIRTERQGTFASSLFVFILCVAILMFGILGLGLGAHVPIVFAAMAAILYGLYLHIPFAELEQAMIKTVSESMGSMLILLVIGMLIASWIACGTVPYIIYLGLNMINPSWFLLLVVILCGVMSSITGSSWTTIGTIGVAFMGIAIGLGIPVGITAGAIACGAFFGDKCSPVSDFTIFASGVAKLDIYKHCLNVLYTTGPAFLISCVIFGVVGLRYGGGSIDEAAIVTIRDGLNSVYQFGPVLWLPLLALVIMIILKLPAIPSLMIGTLAGIAVAVFYQGIGLGAAMGYLYNGFSAETGITQVDQILNRGGMASMMFVVSLMMCSLAMAGVFERTQMLMQIVYKMGSLIQKRLGLMLATLITGVLMSYFAADPYIAALVPVKAFEHQYDEMGLDRSVLSRTISDGAVCMCPIVPWGSSGVFVSQTLGVAVGVYFPFYFMGFLTPVFTILTAATGIGIKYVKKAVKDKASA